MVDTRDHGGGCCGITHVIGFWPYGDVPGLIQQLNHRIRTKKPNQHLYEVVITDNQFNEMRGGRKDFMEALRAKGFRLVSRFRNRNSGNICNVFHRCNQVTSRLEGWED